MRTDTGSGNTKRRVGRRTTYNDTLEAIHDAIHGILEEHIGQHSTVMLTVTGVAAELDQIGERTVRDHGYPAYWHSNYESCTWERYKGLRVNVYDYFRERAEILRSEREQ